MIASAARRGSQTRARDSANTTPLTMIGIAGAVRSFDVQSGSIENAPLFSPTRSATTAPLRIGPLVARATDVVPDTSARIHRAPAPSL